ncbi:SpoIIE family protein phosphatase [Pseudomonas sp. Marseille-QA0892]
MTAFLATRVVAVAEEAHVDGARRMVVRLAETRTGDKTLLGRITIVVQEMAFNLVRHAGHGQLLCTLDANVLDVLAVDSGPGMSNIDRCLSDNYSTSGTLGAGLGAIRRQSDVFDIYSRPGDGTVVLARFHLDARSDVRPTLTCGAVCTPHPHEEMCGDGWAVLGNRLMVCDGLGHGPHAEAASLRAREVFLAGADRYPLNTLMDNLHHALMSTRGAAISLAELDTERRQVSFCGIGNVAGRLMGTETRSLISNNGTVGYKIGRVQTFTYPWTPGASLIVNSDGLTSKLGLQNHPGSVARHPAVIAALLHRDYRRHNDDATVLVLKHA